MTMSKQPAWVPILAILGSVTFLGLGTSLAKHTLFPLVGAQGTTAIRVGFSALLMLLILRPWRWKLARRDVRAIACYGAALGGMNLCFYLALRTIPFGVAVAIEFAGPLAVALFASRRAVDFVWIVLAVAGLGLLLPLGGGVGGLDTAGVLYALAAAVFWGAYILFGKRAGHLPAGVSVSLGLTVAFLVVAPVGIAHAGTALLSPWVLAVGVAVAVISSAVPITLEMVALKRLPPNTFGIMISMEPAVAALLALVLLGEQLSMIQTLAIGLIVTASMGSALMVRRARPVAASVPGAAVSG